MAGSPVTFYLQHQLCSSFLLCGEEMLLPSAENLRAVQSLVWEYHSGSGFPKVLSSSNSHVNSYKDFFFLIDCNNLETFIMTER